MGGHRAADDAMTASAETTRTASPTRIVLFVDGDPLLRDVYEREARRGGYHPLLAADAREALSLFETRKPDCVITDVELPGELSGADLIAELRRSRLGAVIPILAVSPGAKSLRGVTDAVIGHDVDDFLEKPVHGERLLWRISELIKGRPIGLVAPGGLVVHQALRPVMLERGTDFLQGTLQDRDLATLFFSFFATSRSGKLVVMKDKEVRQIWFRRGFPVFAESNVPAEEIGTWLKTRGLVDEEALTVTRTEWSDADRSLGTLLIARGALGARAWFTQLRENVSAAIDRLFEWSEGQYYLEYHADSSSFDAPETVSTWRSPAWFVVEGIRSHYSAARCRSLFENSQGPLQVSDSAHFILRELEEPYYFENLFSQIDGRHTAQETLSRHPFDGDGRALSSLAALWVVGAIVETVTKEQHRKQTADPRLEAIRNAVASVTKEHPDRRNARTARIEERMERVRSRRNQKRRERGQGDQGGVASIMGALEKVSSEVAMENGARLFQTRDYAGAVRAFKEASGLSPRSAQAFFMLGQSCLMLEDSGPEELMVALQALKRAVGLDPDAGGHYHWLGVALIRLGYREEARLTLRRAQELGSEYSEESRTLLDTLLR